MSLPKISTTDRTGAVLTNCAVCPPTLFYHGLTWTLLAPSGGENVVDCQLLLVPIGSKFPANVLVPGEPFETDLRVVYTCRRLRDIKGGEDCYDKANFNINPEWYDLESDLRSHLSKAPESAGNGRNWWFQHGLVAQKFGVPNRRAVKKVNSAGGAFGSLYNTASKEKAGTKKFLPVG
ncbi:hypothetical protein C8J57DRAFT_1240833 [Mycena rebaudengoi]|nr:hypothetical protein C8J57DRAFT_1240833 [Mycena rebaudengoi]